MTAAMASTNVLDAVKSFSLSGSAAVFAEFVTIPLDTAKVHTLALCLHLPGHMRILQSQHPSLHIPTTLCADVGAIAAPEQDR